MASSQDEVEHKSESSQETVPTQVPMDSASESLKVPEQVPVKSPKSQPSSELSSTSSQRDGGGKITKPKNQGRVAAGKKLAEMNRKDKEKKTKPSSEQSEEGGNINWGYVIGGAGLIIAGGSLYYNYKSHHRAEAAAAPKVANNPLPMTTPAPKSKLREMD